MNRSLLIILLGVVTIWDTVTTVYGTYTIFGEGTIQLVVSIGFALLLAGFLIRTIPIIKNPSEELIPVGTKVLWFLAILYDLFTSFTGNMDLILGNATGTQKVVLAIGLTLFVCSAPIGLSKLFFDPDSE
ncbi:hypothetical protein [Aequorivita antarctica]|uniref:Uncharacterized protein n=1 Tax=Aequorivita antarctica TaxID=153266 RepID=A0A5C6YZM7_9FLAO|nr:hypothetical protein [Aequorivita antarctica]TXD72722.1 hypothetical protein ESU54_10900 [Aequorivita antarctica]SRX74754.1 hypothetical protein AEQU3_01734 [Aequorivita antarctica]